MEKSEIICKSVFKVGEAEKREAYTQKWIEIISAMEQKGREKQPPLDMEEKRP